jgi:hypothetical protein
LQTYDGENGDPKKLLAFDGLIGVPALKIELPTYTAKSTQANLFAGLPASQAPAPNPPNP